MDGFWIKRLPKLLIPVVLCNVISFVSLVVTGRVASILSLFSIDNWVKVLLLFYLIFWLVYYIPYKVKVIGGGYWQDLLICLFVVMFSLVNQLAPIKLMLWPAESVGFIYGIILANCLEQFKRWTEVKWINKSIMLTILGGVLGIVYLKFKPVEF